MLQHEYLKIINRAVLNVDVCPVAVVQSIYALLAEPNSSTKIKLKFKIPDCVDSCSIVNGSIDIWYVCRFQLLWLVSWLLCASTHYVDRDEKYTHSVEMKNISQPHFVTELWKNNLTKCVFFGNMTKKTFVPLTT